MFGRKTWLLVVLLLLLPLLSMAKTTSEADLMKMFTLFIHGEEFIEENEWSESTQWLADLNKKYSTIRPTMAKDLPAADIDKFDASLKALQTALAARNHDKSHNQFLTLHKAFLDLLGKYDFKVPPLLYVVQNDLKETKEAIKSNNLEELESELQELDEYYEKLVPFLLKKRVSPEAINETRALIVMARVNYSAKNISTVGTLVDQIQQSLASQAKQISGH